ncbi:MAG: hypothetical protein HYY96_14755 [Candidatus Tectomicrobia bacterium]|nr:hypothetical protein [Candidatus Tectomicrobia bacterium]
MDAAGPCFLSYVPRLLRLRTTQAGARFQEADFLHAEYLPAFTPLGPGNPAADNGELGALSAPPRRASAAQSRALARIRGFVRRMLRLDPQAQRPDAASPSDPYA